MLVHCGPVTLPGEQGPSIPNAKVGVGESAGPFVAVRSALALDNDVDVDFAFADSGVAWSLLLTTRATNKTMPRVSSNKNQAANRLGRRLVGFASTPGFIVSAFSYFPT